MSTHLSTARTNQKARHGRYFGKAPLRATTRPRLKSAHKEKSSRNISAKQSSPSHSASKPERSAVAMEAVVPPEVKSSHSICKSEPWRERLTRKDVFEILMYAVGVILPMTMFSAILLGLVYGYRVDSEAANKDIEKWENSSHKLHSSYIYVHYSSTQLMFITSWSSSIAPILLCFMMKLWHIEASKDIVEASKGSDQRNLTTPFQLSLIINMSNGELSELIFYTKYLFWKRKAKRPPVFSKTAFVLALGGLLSVAIFITDTVLHYTTPTLSHRAYLSSSMPTHSFSRGLIDECIGFNRTENSAWPCTWLAEHDTAPGISNFTSGTFRDGFAMQGLLYNSSSEQQLHLIDVPGLETGGLQLLLSRTESLPSGLNFDATTIGASTQCMRMTEKCSVDYLFSKEVSNFNCSMGFHNLLTNSSLQGIFLASSTMSVSRSSLGFWAHFVDADLKQAYNSIGETDSAISAANVSNMLPDSALVNPLYLGALVYFKLPNTSESNTFFEELAAVPSLDDPSYVAVALNCTLSSYDVKYRWSNGSVSLLSHDMTRNGSIVNLFHGVSYQLQDLFAQAYNLATLQDTSQGFMTEFANSYSSLAMAVIGSVMGPRPSLEEVTWKDILVTRVPVVALWSFIAANMLFALLGLVLAIRTLKASSSPDLKDLVTKIGVAGMTAASLEDCPLVDGKGPVMSEEELFEESRIGDGSRRIGAYPNGRGGFQLVTFR